MNNSKLAVATFLCSAGSLVILSVFAYKGLKAQEKVDEVGSSLKNIAKDPVKSVTSLLANLLPGQR